MRPSARAILAKIAARRRVPLIRFGRRIAYGFALERPVPKIRAAVPLEFTLSAEPPAHVREAARPGPRPPVDADLWFRAAHEGREVYRMRVSVDAASIGRLVPMARPVGRAAFFYACETAPNQRGRNIYPAALAHGLDLMRRQGIDRVFIRVHPRNLASIRGIEKAGFLPLGLVVHLVLWGVPIRPLGVPMRRAPGATP